jgi:hypothetical protein
MPLFMSFKTRTMQIKSTAMFFLKTLHIPWRDSNPVSEADAMSTAPRRTGWCFLSFRSNSFAFQVFVALLGTSLTEHCLIGLSQCPSSLSFEWESFPLTRFARWYIFKPKIAIWANLGGPSKWKRLVYSLAIYNIFLVKCVKRNLATLLSSSIQLERKPINLKRSPELLASTQVETRIARFFLILCTKYLHMRTDPAGYLLGADILCTP